LVTPPRLDLGRGALSRLSALDWAHVDALLSELVADARNGLASAGCKPADITLRFGADMRYFGQQNEVTTWFDTDPREKHDPRLGARVVREGLREALSPAAAQRGRRGGELASDRHRPRRRRATPCPS
jgi:N-methylhydantoinase A